ncbi:hypothetical protein J4448_01500 [Candidatus Woesearchaeota archaeon]|nr:hypothetical protein [Candidatus Woesearchaeota archaeon]
MAKTVNLVIGIIVLLIGVFYALMPHSVHVASGIGFGLSHGVHVVLGLILLIVGIVILLLGRKK